MNELEKVGFATFVNNGDGWERIPNAKFMMRDENGTEIEMTPNEVIKQLMQDNKSLEYCINNLQSKMDKANELLDRLLKDAYYDGEYIRYDYSTSDLLELKGVLKEDEDETNNNK